MLEVVGTKILGRVIDAAVRALEKKIDLGTAATTQIDKKDSKDSIKHHIHMVSNWASEISFRDLSRSKRLAESFVDLDLTLGPIPMRMRAPESEAFGPVKVTDLLDKTENVVILGDPGAGKTTSLKRLTLSALKDKPKADNNKTPILIRLRDLSTLNLFTTILSILGVHVQFEESLGTEAAERTTIRIVGQLLRNLNALLLVDGLDELSYEDREKIVENLRTILLHSKGYQVIVTCRTADFVYNFENAALFAIEPLSDEQIRDFASKWLGEEAGKNLVEEIRNTPYGGTEVLPLTLAHLCAIYERYGSVPEKPRTVYRKVVRLLVEEWDEQRSVRRQSRYASFDVDRKEEFLKAFAYELTLATGRSSFNYNDLENAYHRIHDAFNLPEEDTQKVARELESHTGLIVDTGFENYEFAHKSIQEYLCAEYILKLPKIPSESTIRLPDEMALAVVLSSDSSEYFLAVVESVVKRSRGTLENFTYPFLRRVLLEKVDFRATLRIGWAVLALYSETYYPSTGQLRLPIPSGEDVFSDFLSLSRIQRAANLAIEKSEVTPEEVDIYQVSPLSDARPIVLPLMPHRSKFLVDKRYFKSIASSIVE